MQKTSTKQKNANDDDQDDQFLTTMQVQQQEISMSGNYHCSHQQDEVDDTHPRRLLSHPHFIQKICRYIRVPPGDYFRPIEFSHINQGWDETFWHYQTLHTTFWNKSFRWYPPSVVIKNIATCTEIFKESVKSEGKKYTTASLVEGCVKRKSHNSNKNNNTNANDDANNNNNNVLGGGVVAATIQANPGALVDCNFCDACLHRRVLDIVSSLAANPFDARRRLSALVVECDPSINGLVLQDQMIIQTERSQNLKFYHCGGPTNPEDIIITNNNNDHETRIKKQTVNRDFFDSLRMKSRIWNSFRFCLDDSFYKWIQEDIKDVKSATSILPRPPSPLSGLSFKSHVLPFLAKEDNNNNNNNDNNSSVPLKNVLLVGRLLFDGFMQQPALMQRLFSHSTSITGYLQKRNLDRGFAVGKGSDGKDILIHALLIDCIQYACDSNFLENNKSQCDNSSLDVTLDNNNSNDDENNNNNNTTNESPSPVSSSISSIAAIRALTKKPRVEVFTTLFDSFFKASVLMRSSLRIANATDIGRLSVLSPIFACSASISPVLEAILGGNIWCLEIMLDRIVYWTKTRQSLLETGMPGLDDEEIRKAKSKILRKNVMIKNQADAFKYRITFAADGSDSNVSSAYGFLTSFAADGVPQSHPPGVEAANADKITTSSISTIKDVATFILRSAAPSTALDLAGHCGNAEMYAHLWNEYYKESYLGGADDGVLSRVATNGFVQYDLFDISFVQLPVLAAFPISMDHLKLPSKMMMMRGNNNNNNSNSKYEELATNRLKIFGMKLKHLVEKWNVKEFLNQEQQRKEFLEREEDKRNLHKLAQILLETEKKVTTQPGSIINNGDDDDDGDCKIDVSPPPAAPAPAAAAPFANSTVDFQNYNTNASNQQQQQQQFQVPAGATASAIKFADQDESGRTYSLKQHILWTLRLSLAAITTFYSSHDIMTAMHYNSECLLKTAFSYLQVFFENVPVEIIQEALAQALLAEATKIASSSSTTNTLPVTHAHLNQSFIDYSSSTFFLLRLLMKPTATSTQQHQSSSSSSSSSSSTDYSEKIHSLVHTNLFSSPSSKQWLRDLVEILDGFSSHAPIWVLVDLFDRVNKSSTAESMLDTFHLLLERGSNVFRKKTNSGIFFDPTPLLISDPRCRRYAKPKAIGAVNESASLLAAHFHLDSWRWRTSEFFKRRDLEFVVKDLSGITLLHRLCIRLPRRMYVEDVDISQHQGFRGDEKVEEEASNFQIRMNLNVNAVRSLLRRIELHEKGGIDTVRQFAGTRTENLLLTAWDFAEVFMISKMKNVFEEEFGI